MPRIRAHVFHCICDIGFRSAGSTRPLCSWASTCFYCYSLPCCTRCCWYRYGGRVGPRRWRCSIANLRLGKKNEWRHFASDTCHIIIFIFHIRFFFIVLVDSLCWAPIIASKMFVTFTEYEIPGKNSHQNGDEVHAFLLPQQQYRTCLVMVDFGHLRYTQYFRLTMPRHPSVRHETKLILRTHSLINMPRTPNSDP